MSGQAERGAGMRRAASFLRKEVLQIVRDPSSIALAIVMPVVLILLFGYGVTLDVRDARIAVVFETLDQTPRDLVARLEGSTAFVPVRATSTQQAEAWFDAHRVDGIVRFTDDFEERLGEQGPARYQLILRAVDSNRARLIQGYVESTLGVAQAIRRRAEARPTDGGQVGVEVRTWFNASLRSTDTIVPGLVALVMTLTGTLLTALVIAREWERGTMEGVLATPLRPGEMLVAKIVPYYLLGMAGMALTVGLGVFLFGVPLRGSVAALTGVSSLFLLASLGLGLAISSLARVQFVAAQFSIIAGFLPAFFLSGLLFDLDSTPFPVQVISHIVPARYFVEASRTLFLAGDIWNAIDVDVFALAVMAAFWLVVARRRLGAGRLDG
jgi:ABC-2 type transport system permease protein